MITNYSTSFERLDFKRHDCAEQFFPLDSIVNDDDKDDNDACRPGETVELPCDASDADKFVRVWMKVRFTDQW